MGDETELLPRDRQPTAQCHCKFMNKEKVRVLMVWGVGKSAPESYLAAMLLHLALPAQCETPLAAAAGALSSLKPEPASCTAWIARPLQAEHGWWV